MKLIIGIFVLFFYSICCIFCGQIIIKPDRDNGRIIGDLNGQFVITCSSVGNLEDRPKALQWKSSFKNEFSSNPEDRIYVTNKGDSLQLFFNEVLAEDSGVYTCSGIENGQLIEKSVEFVLNKKISFLDTPKHQYIKAGDKERLIECKTEGNPGPDITWKRNFIELKNDAKYTKTNDGLLIRNIQIEDGGVYKCVAMVQATGEVKTLDIQVDVITLPQWIHLPVDSEGVRGREIELKCEAHGTPKPKVEFRREGITLGGPRYIFNDQKVIIRQLDSSDQGTYTCIATNIGGEILSNFRLNVLIGPELAYIDTIVSLENERAALRCDVLEANPLPEFKWIYSDTRQEINMSDPRISIVSNELWSELRIENVRKTDRRNYTCVATNRALSTERSGILLVKYRPVFINDHEALDRYYSWIIQDQSGATRGQAVKLICKAQGYPQVSIKWSFNRVTITDSTKYKILETQDGLSRLEVTPRDITDFGAYQCDADNSVGKSTRDILLLQASVPKVTPKYEISEIKPDSIKLLIQPVKDTNDNLPIEYYKIQWIAAQSSLDWSSPNDEEIPVNPQSMKDLIPHELKNLVPNTEYSIRIAAVNKPGVGQWSSTTKVTTQTRRQPDPVRLTSKHECDFINRCIIEWKLDSDGGSQILDFTLRWRRVYYKDVDAKYIEKTDQWSSIHTLTNNQYRFEIKNLSSNSYYEIEIRARNEIGISPVVPERVKTLPSLTGEL